MADNCWRNYQTGATKVTGHWVVSHPPPPSPVQQVPQFDLDWESGMLGMRAYERRPSGTMWGGSVTVRLWSRQAGGTVGDRLDRGSLSTGRPTPLMSARRRSPTVGASLHPCLSHVTLADHPYLKKCPARFKFSQECDPSELPPAHLDPSEPGKPCHVCSLCVFGVWPRHWGQLRASVS